MLDHVPQVQRETRHVVPGSWLFRLTMPTQVENNDMKRLGEIINVALEYLPRASEAVQLERTST